MLRQETTNQFPVKYLLNFSLAKYDVIPPSLVWSSQESLQEVLVDRKNDVVKVCRDVSKRGRDGREDLADILQLRDEVPPVLLRAQELHLRYAARNVGVEVEILLDGGHQDQLTDKSVMGCGGAEICFKYLKW